MISFRYGLVLIVLVILAATLFGLVRDRVSTGKFSLAEEKILSPESAANSSGLDRLSASPSPETSGSPVVHPPATFRSEDVEKSGWRLTFGDEFNDTRLDTMKWQTQYWWGRTNPKDAQYYAPDAFDVGNGLLRIKGEKRPMEGYAFTSGLISTYNSFHFAYGYVEARVKVPRGQGLWPAFWLLTDNHQSDSEIDVMEILGSEPQRVYAMMHYDDSKMQPQQVGSSFAGPDFSQDFHIFAVDWSPQAIIWYVDGIERYRVTQNVPKDSMYVILNMAVGSIWSGYPDSTTVFPAYYDIDYVRVYQQQ